jgi:hypothetical protein
MVLRLNWSIDADAQERAIATLTLDLGCRSFLR